MLHLLYARFFAKVMNEMGLCSFREPFARLFNQGMIGAGGAKMSKSKGNVVNPLEYADRYGADTVRMYTLFMGPADEDMDWQDNGLEGIWRFLNRIWRIAHEQAAVPAGDPGTGALARKTHQTIAKVTDDIDRRFSFHTAISAVMELVNEIAAAPRRSGRALRDRDRRVPDPALRAARGRGAVGRHRSTKGGCGRAPGRWPIPRFSSTTRSRSRCR